MEEAGTGCSVLVLLMLSLSPLVLCGVCAGVTLCHKQLKQRRSGMNIDVANLNDFELWDEEYSHSRTDVGFVGLSNQGATCYMNSLIQGLFMTPEFRDALYESTAPAAAEAGAGLEVLLEAEEYQEQLKKGSSNIPRQLQLLFARLQLSKRRAVGTVNLTSSFGWGSDEAFQQQDVSELFTMLIDALEQSLQVQQASLASTGGDATSLASPSALFAGSMNSVLEYWLPDGQHVLRRRTEGFNSIGASATPLPLQHWQYVRPAGLLVLSPRQARRRMGLSWGRVTPAVAM